MLSIWFVWIQIKYWSAWNANGTAEEAAHFYWKNPIRAPFEKIYGVIPFFSVHSVSKSFLSSMSLRLNWSHFGCHLNGGNHSMSERPLFSHRDLWHWRIGNSKHWIVASSATVNHWRRKKNADWNCNYMPEENRNDVCFCRFIYFFINDTFLESRMAKKTLEIEGNDFFSPLLFDFQMNRWRFVNSYSLHHRHHLFSRIKNLCQPNGVDDLNDFRHVDTIQALLILRFVRLQMALAPFSLGTLTHSLT